MSDEKQPEIILEIQNVRPTTTPINFKQAIGRGDREDLKAAHEARIEPGLTPFDETCKKLGIE